MIRKNILAIALLGVIGLSQAADVENLRTMSYLNEPLRLQADIIGDGDVLLAAPTEYLRLNHPIPNYDLSIDVVETNGKKQVILSTTEEIESPAITLLLESRDANNRRQLFELPVLLDFKPENPPVSAIDVVAEASADVAGNDVDTNIEAVAEVQNIATETTEVASVEDVAPANIKLEDVPAVAATTETSEVVETKVEPPIKEKTAEKAKVEVAEVIPAKKIEPAQKAPKEKVATETKADTSKQLVKRYGPVAQGETLWSIANKVRPTNVTAQKMISIIKANNPSAFTPDGVLKANVTLIIPTETEKFQHKLVKSPENNTASQDVRVGFIYELPEPPVQAATETENTEVAEVNTESVADTEDVASVKVVLSNEEPVEPPKTDVSSAPVDTVTTEVTMPTTASEVQVVETPEKAEAVKAPEPPKKPVYIMAEPEPEPNIIDLLFENIMYVGAGALVIILAILAIVMRRKKDTLKPVKEKGKKKGAEKSSKEINENEEVVVSEVAPTEEVAPEEKGIKKLLGFLGKKKDKAPKEKTAKTSKKLKLAKTEQPTEVVEEVVVDAVAPIAEPDVKKASSVAPIMAAAAVTTAIAESVEPKVEDNSTAIESLDFDLSGIDSSNSGTETASVKIEAEEKGLDFSTELTEGIASLAPADEADAVEHEYGALDFDLSFGDDSSTAITEIVETDEPETFGGLDFDLSGFSIEEAPKEEVEIEHNGVDLDFTAFSTDTAPVEASVETVESFGENNPLFAAQSKDEKHTEVAVENIETSDEGGNTVIDDNYISFPELLGDAKDTLAQDDIKAEKPTNFDDLAENEEAGLAKLFESTKKAEVEQAIDLSFIAEADEEQSGLDFLNTLDLSTEVALDDPINSSVKDNVAKSDEALHAEEVQEISELDLPEVTQAIEEDNPVVEIDLPETTEISLPEVESSTVVDEPIIEDPEVESVIDLDFNLTEIAPEPKLAEPTIVDEPVLDLSMLDLPEVAPIIEEPIIQAPEVTLVEPVIQEEEIVMPAESEPVAVVESVVPVQESTNPIQDADFESEQVKLELAIAYMDFDSGLAKPLLLEVVNDGSAKQIEQAKELLAKID